MTEALELRVDNGVQNTMVAKSMKKMNGLRNDFML